jgi:hypothetical protein
VALVREIAAKLLWNTDPREAGKERGWGRIMTERNEGDEGNEEDKEKDIWKK